MLIRLHISSDVCETYIRARIVVAGVYVSQTPKVSTETKGLESNFVSFDHHGRRRPRKMVIDAIVVYVE